MEGEEVDVAVVGFADAEDDVFGDEFSVWESGEAGVVFEGFSVFVFELGKVGIGDFDDSEVNWGFVAGSIADKVEKAATFTGNGDSEPCGSRGANTECPAIGLFGSGDEWSEGSAGKSAAFRGEVVGIESIAPHGIGVEGFAVRGNIPVDGIGFGS